MYINPWNLLILFIIGVALVEFPSRFIIILETKNEFWTPKYCLIFSIIIVGLCLATIAIGLIMQTIEKECETTFKKPYSPCCYLSSLS